MKRKLKNKDIYKQYLYRKVWIIREIKTKHVISKTNSNPFYTDLNQTYEAYRVLQPKDSKELLFEVIEFNLTQQKEANTFYDYLYCLEDKNYKERKDKENEPKRTIKKRSGFNK